AFRIVCLTVIVLAGCARVGISVRTSAEEPVAPVEPEEIDLEALRGRFEAAKKISVVFDRDDAMKQLARDIATRGNASNRERLTGLLKQVLDSVNVVFARDEVARACALGLARRGMTAEATAVAEQINVSFERDAVLKRIASGNY